MSDHKPEGLTTKMVHVHIGMMGNDRIDVYLPDDDQTKARLAEFMSQLAGGKLATLEDESGRLHLVMCINVQRVTIRPYLRQQ